MSELTNAEEQETGPEMAAVVDDSSPGPQPPSADRTMTLAPHAPRIAPAANAPLLPARYRDLGRIAAGSFGEIRRVFDTELDRVVAMKLLRANLADVEHLQVRFLAEAKLTAGLEHPGIVGVHDRGRLEDGRLWFTMREVRGRTLGDVIDEVHAAAGREGFGETASGWTFRRLVDAFARVCQAVAYAHRRGVVHRDLKPDNMMVGELGEALVMDWGLSRRVDARDAQDEGESAPSDDGASPQLTRVGDVLGTPAFMPPEQARGERHLHGLPSDVYALGAVLYHVLAGRPPYEGGSALVVLRQVLAGAPVPVVDAAGDKPVPAELAAICARAMEREMAARYPDAEALASDVVAWLDGARRREQALLALEHARVLEPRIAALREREAAARAEAQRLLGELRPFDSVEEKRQAWAKEDEAERSGREALLQQTEWLQGTHAALRIDPELPEAHAALAAHYRAELRDAEAQQRPGDAASFEVMLRAHDRGEHAAFLRGEGTLTLVTDPPGAQVWLERYEERDRRLQPQDRGLIGRTPLSALPLLQGSYRARLRFPGCAEVFYPLRIERDAHWDGCAPGETEPTPVALPPADELGPDDVYVPAGWSWIGGHASAADALPRRRIWIEGFVIGRFPVTSAEWLVFMNALVTEGREEEALLACPRSQFGSAASGGAVRGCAQRLFGRDGAGRFVLPPDWQADLPVILVDWHAASAYARWMAGQSGRAWRLPNELEREKAARGVDERLLPWGNHPDATFVCVAESHPREQSRAPVSAYPHDESPYGVRGLAGNVRDTCINAWKLDGPKTSGGRLLLDPAEPSDPSIRAARGGAWGSPIANAWSAGRFASRPELGWNGVGVRLTRSWPAASGCSRQQTP